jgi:hypothetical protein
LYALAYLEGFETIYTFGVDMAQDDEYSEQRPSCEFYLGQLDNTCIHSDNCDKATLRKLFVPAKCDLLKTIWEYPYEDHKPFKQKIDARRKELREGADEAAQIEQEAMLARIQKIGIIEFINALQGDPNIADGDFLKIPQEALDQQREQLRMELEQASHNERNAHDNRMSVLGALENMRYINKTWNQCANELTVLDEVDGEPTDVLQTDD